MTQSAQIQDALKAIRKVSDLNPQVGIILGTGLGQLVEELDIENSIPYAEIPGFPNPTVETHSGKLILGKLNGVQVVVMQGRFHLYEGYSAQQIALSVRVLHALGIRQLFISNVSGGLNPNFEIGDIMLIEDHINLQPDNPLYGPNDDALGPRFPDMLHAYDRDLLSKAEGIAKGIDTNFHRGVYVAVLGPNLETVAEYKFLRFAGADTVGMSTVPEVITARHLGLPVFAASIITDLGVPEKIKPVSVPEIIGVALKTQPKLTRLFSQLIREMA
jgi:purine-nucleoside phosphorylase